MWKKIFFNKLNVETSTERAVLIKMPSKSDYVGFSFWHPSKLVRDEGGNGYHKSFSFTNEFEFRLIKYGKGKYNKREIIQEITISAEDIESQFSEGVETSIRREKEKKKHDDSSFLEVTEPKKIDEEVEVIECLENN